MQSHLEGPKRPNDAPGAPSFAAWYACAGAEFSCTRRRIGAAPDAADDRPHRQSPSCGKPAAYDKLCEWNDTTPRQHSVFKNPPKPADGLFHLPTGPGLGLQINKAELAKRRVPIA